MLHALSTVIIFASVWVANGKCWAKANQNKAHCDAYNVDWDEKSEGKCNLDPLCEWQAFRGIFFEKQDGSKCMKHAINNLLQDEVMTKSDYESYKKMDGAKKYQYLQNDVLKKGGYTLYELSVDDIINKFKAFVSEELDFFAGRAVTGYYIHTQNPKNTEYIKKQVKLGKKEEDLKLPAADHDISIRNMHYTGHWVKLNSNFDPRQWNAVSKWLNGDKTKGSKDLGRAENMLQYLRYLATRQKWKMTRIYRVQIDVSKAPSFKQKLVEQYMAKQQEEERRQQEILRKKREQEAAAQWIGVQQQMASLSACGNMFSKKPKPKPTTLAREAIWNEYDGYDEGDEWDDNEYNNEYVYGHNDNYPHHYYNDENVNNYAGYGSTFILLLLDMSIFLVILGCIICGCCGVLMGILWRTYINKNKIEQIEQNAYDAPV